MPVSCRPIRSSLASFLALSLALGGLATAGERSVQVQTVRNTGIQPGIAESDGPEESVFEVRLTNRSGNAETLTHIAALLSCRLALRPGASGHD
jgi:hypothetical protein